MLTGKIPDWGFHRDEFRYGSHLIDVEIPVESVMDWGMLGYFVGDVVQEHIPVLVGKYGRPDLVRHKHFGAAAASSGGVELYHIVGVTPEAPSLEKAFGTNRAVATLRYGAAERRQTYEAINASATDPNVDYATVARGFGVYGEGPITDPKDLAPALQRAIAVVKRGEPALVDVVTDPR